MPFEVCFLKFLPFRTGLFYLSAMVALAGPHAAGAVLWIQPFVVSKPSRTRQEVQVWSAQEVERLQGM